jgi:hypothetical protein
MSSSVAPPAETSLPPSDIDANGVDRAQIRTMLALPAEQRLRRAQEFAQDTLRVWELNGIRPLR